MMDKPETENFLETISGLRKDAEEKLTGNRHYLAIQKLDEIAEAVKKRSMSAQELDATGAMLQGGEASVETPAVETQTETEISGIAIPEVALSKVALGGTAVAGAAAIAATVSSEQSVPEVVIEDVVVEEAAPAVAEIAAPDASAHKEILPNWWQQTEQAEPVIAAPDMVEEVVIETPAPVVEVEEVVIETPEPAVDLSTVAAGAAAIGTVAVGTIVAQSEPEPVAVEIREEVQLIDVPEVNIEAPQVEQAEMSIPDVELPEVELEKVQAPEIDLEALGLEVPKGELLETTITEEDIVIPGIVDPTASVEVTEIVTEITPEIVPDVVPEIDLGTQATAVAAGAAAIATAAVVATPDPEPEPELQPIAEVVIKEAPEKLSFPDASVTETVTETASATTKVWNGDNIQLDPDYGGNRGGFFRRFVNSLRGKDYI